VWNTLELDSDLRREVKEVLGRRLAEQGCEVGPV
jgi:hypothetical protein